jgi:hypothetical protein
MGAGASSTTVAEAKAAGSTDAEIASHLKTTRFNTKIENPVGATIKIAVLQYKVPGHPNGGSDKGPDGNRVDSIPIANGCVKAGAACDMLLYEPSKHAEFKTQITEAGYDAFIVRINPGQLSQGTPEGTQKAFDDMMKEKQVRFF